MDFSSTSIRVTQVLEDCYKGLQCATVCYTSTVITAVKTLSFGCLEDRFQVCLGGEHTLESSEKMFLEGRSSTIELRPQGLTKYYHTPKNAQFQVGGFRQCSLILV